MARRLATAGALALAACGGEDPVTSPAAGGSAAAPGEPSGVPAGPEPLRDLSQPSDPRAWFRDEAVARGLEFTYDSGHRGPYLFPEIIGGGAALFDPDVDGDLDAYLVQAGPLQGERETWGPNQLFENDGAGHFTDVTEGSGAGDRGYGQGVAAGDLDNDGDPDLYVTNLEANRVLWNRQAEPDGLRFEAGVDTGAEDANWGVSASPLDFDEDGFLDLFVVNYVFWSLDAERECLQPTYGPDYCSPNAYEAPAPDTLLRNRGDGTFEDVSFAAGVRTAYGNGLGSVALDYDLDGWTDVFVANDGMENQLWRNRAGEGFDNVAQRMGVAVDDDGKLKAGMGTAASDLDDDGDEDLVVVNLGTESDSLYANHGRYFKDSSARYGLRVVTRRYTRWGVGFQDFDNDGNLDLFQANGRVERPVDFDRSIVYSEPNSLLVGGGAETYFEPAELQGGTLESLVRTSRGAAFGDIDADGGVDVLVVNRDGPATLLHNVVSQRGPFVSLRAVDSHGRDALGATLTIQLSGGRTLTRTVRSDSSYASANDPRVHVGLGEAALQGVAVTWVDGSQERFDPPTPGATTTLRQGAGR